MIKKIVLIVTLVLASVMLLACGRGRGGLVYMSEPKLADRRMEDIVKAIQDEDSEALKAMFSNRSLVESEELDQEIEDLFSFVEGDITKWENDH